MWAGVRELLHYDWNPVGAGDFMALAQGFSNSFRRIVWLTFAALCWTLWNTHNKLTIEGKAIAHPADVFFQISIYIQCWRAHTEEQDATG
jgi:RsiW-degrading membrane proteinase PrsW (M82 family)